MDDVVDLAFRKAEFDGGSQDAFGAVRVADFDEVAEPLFEDFGSSFTGRKWFDDEPWRTSGALGSYLSETLIQSSRLVLRSQEMKEVCGAGEHAEGGPPAFVGVRRAELRADG